MRSPRQQLYDNLYYGFELRMNQFFVSQKLRRSMRSKSVDPEFYEIYRTRICPYWKQFGVKPKIHYLKRVYLRAHSIEPRNIPSNLWHTRIVPYFNSLPYRQQLTNKNLFHLLFPGVKRPETIFKYIDGAYLNDDLTPISEEEAMARCRAPGRYIAKPTVGSTRGYGIRAFCGEDDPAAVRELLRGYCAEDHIVQRFVPCHPDLAVFNPSTLNSLRIVTLRLDGEIHILSAILRIGAPGKVVDNVAQGGYQCAIRPDGTLAPTAYTHRNGDGETVTETHTGAKFEGARVPAWDELARTAKKLAQTIPYMGLVGWDFAVDDRGDVVFIEFNTNPEQNEATCGPSFGDLTEKVLTKVFREKRSAYLRHRYPY